MTQPATAPVWVFGDSTAAGTFLEDPGTQAWPAQLAGMTGCGPVRNLGAGGMAVAFESPDVPRMDAYVKDTLTHTPAGQLPRLILFAGGLNDLIRSLTMDETRWAVFNLGGWMAQNYPAVRFLPMTLTPLRSDHQPAPAAVLSTRRDTFNTWARAQYGQAGQLVDCGDLLCAGATYADPRHMHDSLHPDISGHAILAAGVFAVLHGRGLL